MRKRMVHAGMMAATDDDRQCPTAARWEGTHCRDRFAGKLMIRASKCSHKSGPARQVQMASKFTYLLIASSIIMTSGLPVAAQMERWQELQNEGQEAYSAGKFKKAEKSWSKAVHQATRTEVGDKNLALSLKKLAEADIALHKYREAEARLQQAIKINKQLGDEDPEPIRDLLELAKTFRSVNLEQFGKVMESLFAQAGLNKIEIYKTPGGDSRVEIKLTDKLTKRITSADVDRINLDKTVTFDIHEDKDGTITLSNIKGLKIRSKVWVALTESSIDPSGEEGKPTATVTARKLGLKKTVQTVLPKSAYDRILATVERIKHPELHSPWYKALQEKFKGMLHPTATTPTPAPAKEMANKENTGEGDGAGNEKGEKAQTAAKGESETISAAGSGSEVQTNKTGATPDGQPADVINSTTDMIEHLIP